MDTATVVKRFKSFVETEDLNGAQGFLAGLVSEPESYALAWDHVYQKVYLHACLKKKRDFVEWITGLFEMLEPIEKIALRQTFAYGRYLLNKH
jgi:hypothetical protein